MKDQELPYFAKLANTLQSIIDEDKQRIARHLARNNNSIEIQVKIQSVDQLPTIQSSFINKMLAKPRKKTRSFDVELFEKESREAIAHYSDKCKFYNLPISIRFIFKGNTICGSITTDFCFRDHS